MSVLPQAFSLLLSASVGLFSMMAAAQTPVVPPPPGQPAVPPAAVTATAPVAVPTNALIFQPPGLVINRSGEVWPNSNWSQDDSGSVYTGTAGPAKDQRVEVVRTLSEDGTRALSDIITVVPTQNPQHDVTKMLGLQESAGMFGGIFSPQSSVGANSRYVSVTHMGAGEAVGAIVSQTQCLDGKCVNINLESCAQLEIATKSRTILEMVAKVKTCGETMGSLRTALDAVKKIEAAKPSTDPNAPSVADSFARDIKTLKNSKAIHAANKGGDAQLGFSMYQPKDLEHQYAHLSNFANACNMMAVNNGVGGGAAPAAPAGPNAGKAARRAARTPPAQ